MLLWEGRTQPRRGPKPAVAMHGVAYKREIMSQPHLLEARTGDAARIAMLHADSWRRHYRGAYSDSFLDGDVVTDRLAVWSSRLNLPGSASSTVIAEDGDRLTGFVHVIFDADETWGSLVENLHVSHDRHRNGLGRALMCAAAEAVADHASNRLLHLWVLAQNTAAQRFYRALGGKHVETAPVPPPGGVASRLTGSPEGQRIAWPDANSLIVSRSLEL